MTDRTTRYVDQPERPPPKARDNCRTHLADLSRVLPVPYEALFFAHYRSIRTLARTVTEGLGVVAVEVSSAALVGRAWIARKLDRPNALILGRHTECDLVLDEAEVSLRHLALLVPKTGSLPLQFSVHELNTGLGLQGSSGEAMPGARVERFGMFRMGAYALFTFATGEHDAWPELASEAWAQLDGRVSTLGSQAGPEESRWTRLSSHVASIHGPMHFREPLVKEDEMVTHVTVLGRSDHERLRLGSEALRRGVIFGRYSRCDTVFRDKNISRVHLLVIEVDGEVVGVDTSSTNGVSTDEDPDARVVMLGRGERAIFADGVATLSLRDTP